MLWYSSKIQSQSLLIQRTFFILIGSLLNSFLRQTLRPSLFWATENKKKQNTKQVWTCRQLLQLQWQCICKCLWKHLWQRYIHNGATRPIYSILRLMRSLTHHTQSENKNQDFLSPELDHSSGRWAHSFVVFFLSCLDSKGAVKTPPQTDHCSKAQNILTHTRTHARTHAHTHTGEVGKKTCLTSPDLTCKFSCRVWCHSRNSF